MSVLHKAEKVLDSAYEVYHGDAEQVSHKFLLKKLSAAEEKMDRVLAELSALDAKLNELEERSKNFAGKVWPKVKGLSNQTKNTPP
jgi:hypothetical protein